MDFEEQLIQFCNDNPCLWNKSNSEYRNIIKRDKLWKTLSNKIGAPEEKLKTRWKTLRNTHRIELKKLNQPSGAGAKKQPKWKYFELLSFLKNDIVTPTLSNYDCPTPALNFPEPDSPEINSADFHTSNLITKFTYISDSEEIFSSTPRKLIENKKAKPKSSQEQEKAGKEWTGFLENVAKAISDVAKEKLSEVDTFFQSLAQKTKKENLTNNELGESEETVLYCVNKKLRDIRNLRDLQNLI